MAARRVRRTKRQGYPAKNKFADALALAAILGTCLFAFFAC